MTSHNCCNGMNSITAHLPSSLDAPTFGLTPQVNYELLVQTVTWLTRSGGTQAIGQWLDRFNGTPVSGGHSKTNQVHAMNNQQQQHGVDSSADGEAVLVFLPGMKEITTVQEMLIGSPAFRQSPQRDWVLPLHSVRRFLLSCVSFRFDSIQFIDPVIRKASTLTARLDFSVLNNFFASCYIFPLISILRPIDFDDDQRPIPHHETKPNQTLTTKFYGIQFFH